MPFHRARAGGTLLSYGPSYFDRKVKPCPGFRGKLTRGSGELGRRKVRMNDKDGRDAGFQEGYFIAKTQLTRQEIAEKREY